MSSFRKIYYRKLVTPKSSQQSTIAHYPISIPFMSGLSALLPTAVTVGHSQRSFLGAFESSAVFPATSNGWIWPQKRHSASLRWSALSPSDRQLSLSWTFPLVVKGITTSTLHDCGHWPHTSHMVHTCRHTSCPGSILVTFHNLWSTSSPLVEFHWVSHLILYTPILKAMCILK